jgi:hypothetical protein
MAAPGDLGTSSNREPRQVGETGDVGSSRPEQPNCGDVL